MEHGFIQMFYSSDCARFLVNSLRSPALFKTASGYSICLRHILIDFSERPFHFVSDPNIDQTKAVQPAIVKENRVVPRSYFRGSEH